MVEMLVVIVIIGILASLAMAALFASQEAARRSRTEGLIGVLNNQMAVRWESYRTRRIPVGSGFQKYVQGEPNLNKVAVVQLMARRQLMRIELPDRWWDVAFDDDNWAPPVLPTTLRMTQTSMPPEVVYDGSVGPAGTSGSWITRDLSVWPARVDRQRLSIQLPDSSWEPLLSRTSLSFAYQRRYQQVLQQRSKQPTIQNQGAECLYMILTTNMGDESTGGGIFNDRDFADTDEDGMPELVDGWGKPIAFLRWAPGFRSDMQSGDPINDHDPFDPRKVDRLAYRMFPLISSAGPDGVNDDGINVPQGIESHRIPFNGTDINISLNDPYAPRSEAGWPDNVIFRGQRLEETAGTGPNDNIFNQSLTVR